MAPLSGEFITKLAFAGLLIFGAVVLNIGIMRGDNSIRDYFELRKSREVMQKTIGDLEKENQDLDQEITRLKKSKNYARKVLRDKYHLTDPDENIVFFAD